MEWRVPVDFRGFLKSSGGRSEDVKELGKVCAKW